MIPLAIEEKVKNLKDIDSIFELFEFLGYKKYLYDKTYKRDKIDFGIPKDVIPNIENIYSIFNIEKHLYCFFIETKNISSRSFLKIISKSLLDSYIRVLLIFTDDWKTYYFILPQYEKLEGKKKLKLSTLILDTTQIYHTDLEVISTLGITSGDASYRDIWRDRWQQAFSKERVNDRFFEDFEKVFFELRSLVNNKIKDVKISHEFAQQTLNRLIFLYFIAKKKWLASDKKFISNFYKEYKIERNKGNLPQDSFYENWLKILFFEVFNKSFPNLGIAKYIPVELKNSLITFPYLNGGLFNEEEFDKLGINIPDSMFNKIFAFLDKYNFTIKEDSPLDIEVAVDPQMLGYLYESFANIAEEIYERNDLGVFYTPVSEVDFMVRRSLVEYFANHLEKIPKDIIYKLVFDEDKKEAIEYMNRHNIWGDLEFLIEDVKIVDPACGSGAFLLGSLKALMELTQIIERYLGRERKDFDIKKDIIGNNLFGVDVMKWALHCAELRLWLSMIVEADLSEERRKEALLPNFNLRLRVGDSLVQKIGDINFDLKSLNVSREIKRKLNYLKEEKQKFYRNDPSRKFDNYEAIQKEEIKIFQEILREEIINLTKRIPLLKDQLDKTNQLNIFGETSKDKVKKENIVNEIKLLEEKGGIIERVYNELEKKEKQFVIWEIDFADVFEEKHGFDIVIGNPPYIRQEKISPPFRPKKEINLEEKRKYKEDLIESIKIKYPFIKEFNRKCDYYIYFYFHGLSLLNPKGTFCFITSNSWLDVGYGKVLQEYLAKFVPIKAICDNQVKRSFEHASINTIIVFFGAPLIKNSKNPRPTCLDNVVKFIMLKKPYEEVVSAQNLIAIDNFIPDTQSLFGNILKTNDFRVYAIKQEDLLKEGLEVKEDKNEMFENKLFGEYTGSKWGGKYLRAPDVFFTILKKAKNKLVSLNKFCKVETYLNTGGADKFFFVQKIKDIDNNYCIINNVEYSTNFIVEKELIVHFIKTPQTLNKVLIRENDLSNVWLLRIPRDYKIKDKKVFNYIKWGENKKYNLKSGRQNKSKWWCLPSQAFKYSEIIWPRLFNDSHIIYWNKDLFPFTNFYSIWLPDNKMDWIKLFNSSFIWFSREIFGKVNYGEGAIKTDGNDIKKMLIISPTENIRNVNFDFNRNIGSVFYEFGFNPTKPTREQEPNPLPDRKALDDVVFDALGLTEEERKEVYWATAELVKNRLDKARSVKKK